MLKEEIVQILQETLSSDEENTEIINSIADRIVDACVQWYIPLVADAVTKVLNIQIREENE